MKKIGGFIKGLITRFRQLSKRNKIIVVVIILILSIAIYSRIQGSGKNKYITEKVQKSSIIEYVTESGAINDKGLINVYSPSTGTVVQVLVNNGSIVDKGTELFSVESTATQQEKQTASANFFKAQSELAVAQANANSLRADMFTEWKDFTDLSKTSTYETPSGNPKIEERKAAEFQIAQDDWLAAERLFKNSQTQIAAANAAFSAASYALASTQNATVIAEGSGIVANLAVDTGDTVKAFSPTAISPVDPVLLLTSHDLIAVIPVGQTDISKIHPGQKAILDPDAYSDLEIKGTVEKVDEVGKENQGVVTYNVYVALDDISERIRAAMTVDAKIETKRVNNVLTVPNSSVVLYKGKKAVRIIGKNNEIVHIPVKTGIKGNERTEIVEGLKEGQEIIVSLSNEQIKRPGFFGM